MKKNTKTLLLILSKQKGDIPLVIPLKTLEYIFSKLSSQGRQSLYRSAIKNLLIRSLMLDQQPALSISSHGQNRLIDQFPVFNEKWRDWKGRWLAVVFYEHPKQDPQFRYLRSQCLKYRGISLTRGMYIFADSIPQELESTIQRLYDKSVGIIEISDWKFGVDPSILLAKSGLNELCMLYSGISKELDALLVEVEVKKGLNLTHLQQISNIIFRLLSILEQDPGYTRLYYPCKIGVSDIVGKIQQLLLKT